MVDLERESLLRGAALGVAVGACFAALECALVSLSPHGWLEGWIAGSAHRELRPSASALILGAYAALGAGSGLISVWVRRRMGRRRETSARAKGPGRAVLWAAASIAAAAGVFALAHRPPVPPLPPVPSAPLAARPSVVLVTLDTVRSDHLSVYGYPRATTPELLEFSRSATLYRRSVASSDLTLSTHGSLFTGLYAFHHGARVYENRGARALPESFDTLAEILQRAGYLTIGVVGNPGYLGRRWGLAQGFQVYDDRSRPPWLPAANGHLVGRALAAAARAAIPDAEPSPGAYRLAREVNRSVFSLLDAVRGRSQPLFLFVNYMDAHWPYEPPPPFDRRFPGRLERGGDFLDHSAIENIQSLRRTLTPEERRHIVSQYDGEIAYVDAVLGELLRRLRDQDLFDSSLIVVTADHGEALGEHGLIEHGVSVYQDQVKVPLLIKFPQQREPAVVEAPVSSVDLVPTVLGALGLPVPADLAGVRLDPGPPVEPRTLISESYPTVRLYRRHPRFRRVARAIFAGDRKLIASSSGRRELYDVAADPGESENLYSSPAAAAELESELEEWLRYRPAVRGEQAAVDDESREALRALGYID